MLSVESHLSLPELPNHSSFFRGTESADLEFPFSLDNSHPKADCVLSRDKTGRQRTFLDI